MKELNKLQKAMLEPEFLQVLQQHLNNIASPDELGHIKVGENLTITSDGKLNAEPGFTIHEVNPPWLERIDDFYLSTGTYRMNTLLTDVKPAIKNDLPAADNKTGTLVVLPSGEYGWGIIQIWAGLTTRSLYYRIGLNATSFSPWVKINTDDTGWLNATEGPDWGLPSEGFLRYRRVGDLVYFRGKVICFGSINNAITTLPVGFRPLSSAYIASGAGYIVVNKNGAVLAGGGLKAGEDINFDGVFSIA